MTCSLFRTPRFLPFLFVTVSVVVAACGTEPLVVSVVEVTPRVDTLIVLGASRQFTAVARYGNGDVATASTFTWSSSDLAVATIDAASGLATAIGSGETVIAATAEGVKGTGTLTVQLPAQLAFTQQPAGAAAGASVTPPVRVEVQDGGGHRVTRASDAVTLSIGSNGGGGTLSGTPTQNALAGVATFPDLSIEKAGTGYTLLASSGTLARATSATFAISPAAPQQVMFAQAPSTVTGNVVISPPVQVMVQDAFGNVVPAGQVTMSLGASPWAPRGRLTGTLTVDIINTVATFANLNIDKPGRGYTLRVAIAGVAGVSQPFNTIVPFTAVDLGDGHACGLSPGGPYCWGNAPSGLDSVPELLAGAPVFVEVSAGRFHSCGLTPDGDAYCWGANFLGQLGNGTTSGSGPVLVTGQLKFASISAGGFSTCGVTTSKAVYCWGGGTNGELGNGADVNSTTPVLVLGGLEFTSVSTGLSHSCGVTTAGAADCWGSNFGGELGDPAIPIGSHRNTPVAVQGGYTFRSVSAGGNFNCGVTTGDSAYCWGDGGGRLGDGTGLASSTPVAVTGGFSYTSVSAGYAHACGVLTTTPYLACWGGNGSGQVGDGTTQQRNGAVVINLGTTVSAVSAGEDHTCALTGAGLLCWGSNAYGQLGDGTRVSSLTAVPVVQ